MPRALITGVTGQDGRYLAEFLLDKGYEVFGTIHRSPQGSTRNGMEIPRLRLLEADLLDKSSLVAAIELSQPDEVYNLGGISYVPLSFLRPELTADITGMGLVRLLDAIRLVGGTESNPIRLYQASSSEMFGRAQPVPYSEETPLRPISPYAAAKTFAHNMTFAYRNESNLFAASGILFNHESPRRPIEFVSRKVTNAVARISLGLQSELSLGNLEAQRDWGFAGDFAKSDVAHVAAGRAPGLRHRDWQTPLCERPGRNSLSSGRHRGLGAFREGRSPLRPSSGSQRPTRGRFEGRASARMESQHQIRRHDPDNDRARSRG